MCSSFLIYFFGVYILSYVQSCSDGSNNYKKEYCIQMTPEKEKEIHSITDRIGKYMQELSDEYEHYDIRLAQFDIEAHYDDEVDEKDMVLKISINDCAKLVKTKENDSNTHTKSKTNDNHPDIEVNNNSNALLTDVKQNKGNYQVELIENGNAKTKYAGQGTILVKLNLPENGKELLNILEKERGNHPIPVYMQKTKGKQEFVFLRDFRRHSQDKIWRNNLTPSNNGGDQITGRYQKEEKKNADVSSKPLLMALRLEENGRKLLDAVGEKSGHQPLLVYVQKED